MDKKIFVIIDMQPDFEAANNKETLMNVIEELERAKDSYMPILIVSYRGHGKTHRDILEALEGYENKHFVHKSYDDGSQEIMSCVREEEIEVDEFIVCGVNTCACVAQTVSGLIKQYYKQVTVLSHACNCVTSSHDHQGIIPPEHYNDNHHIYNHCNCSVLEEVYR